MADNVEMSISIPSDDDGFFLLRCEHCGEFFKLIGDDIESDVIFDVSCPACGLTSESFVTDDVINLAMAKVKNYALDMVYDAFKEMERKSKNKYLKIKAGNKPEHEAENPIRSGIEALELAYFSCCGKKAKIKPLLKFTGCYCPCCGVKNYEVE